MAQAELTLVAGSAQQWFTRSKQLPFHALSLPDVEFNNSSVDRDQRATTTQNRRLPGLKRNADALHSFTTVLNGARQPLQTSRAVHNPHPNLKLINQIYKARALLSV